MKGPLADHSALGEDHEFNVGHVDVHVQLVLVIRIRKCMVMRACHSHATMFGKARRGVFSRSRLVHVERAAKWPVRPARSKSDQLGRRRLSNGVACESTIRCV